MGKRRLLVFIASVLLAISALTVGALAVTRGQTADVHASTQSKSSPTTTPSTTTRGRTAGVDPTAPAKSSPTSRRRSRPARTVKSTPGRQTTLPTQTAPLAQTTSGAETTSGAQISSATQTTPGTQATSGTQTTPGTQYTKLVFSDDFGGAAGTPPSSLKWTHDVGAYGAPDHELQTYTDSPANASLDGHGNLAIVARRQTVTGPDGLKRNYTSARLDTQGRFSTTHGLIEARMKIPAGDGLWSAFWMLGNDINAVGYPQSGEIDVMETLGQTPFAVRGTLHGPDLGSEYARGQDADSDDSLATGFHTYAVSWSPNSITWLLDGRQYATVTSASLAPGQSWVFNHPFNLLLDLAVGGDWPGPPDASTPFPATLLIDWVRVYQ